MLNCQSEDQDLWGQNSIARFRKDGVTIISSYYNLGGYLRRADLRAMANMGITHMDEQTGDIKLRRGWRGGAQPDDHT